MGDSTRLAAQVAACAGKALRLLADKAEYMTATGAPPWQGLGFLSSVGNALRLLLGKAQCMIATGAPPGTAEGLSCLQAQRCPCCLARPEASTWSTRAALLCAGPDLRSVAGACTGAQARNIALCSQLTEVHRSLAALLARLPPPAAASLACAPGAVLRVQGLGIRCQVVLLTEGTGTLAICAAGAPAAARRRQPRVRARRRP